jgi:hypothetical protein
VGVDGDPEAKRLATKGAKKPVSDNQSKSSETTKVKVSVAYAEILRGWPPKKGQICGHIGMHKNAFPIKVQSL